MTKIASVAANATASAIPAAVAMVRPGRDPEQAFEPEARNHAATPFSGADQASVLHPPERFDPLRDRRIVGRHDKSDRAPPHMVEHHGERGLTRVSGRAGRSARRPAARSENGRAPVRPDALRLPAGQFFWQPIRDRGETEGSERIAGLHCRLRLGRPRRSGSATFSATVSVGIRATN